MRRSREEAEQITVQLMPGLTAILMRCRCKNTCVTTQVRSTDHENACDHEHPTQKRISSQQYKTSIETANKQLKTGSRYSRG